MSIDPKLLDPSNESWERYQFLSNNCVKLAQFLESVPDQNHDQSFWWNGVRYTETSDNSCGTVCCAMGWAVHAEVVKGIKTYYNRLGMGYIVAGSAFFGNETVQGVFLNTRANKINTINALYCQARMYCDTAKSLKRIADRQVLAPADEKPIRMLTRAKNVIKAIFK